MSYVAPGGAENTSARGELRNERSAVALAVAFGTVAAAAATLGLFLFLRYVGYQAVQMASGSVRSGPPSTGARPQTWAFVLGEPSDAVVGWYALAHLGSLAVAFVIGLLVGWRIATRTWRRAAKLFGPARSGFIQNLLVLIRCAAIDTAAMLTTFGIVLAVGAFAIFVAVMWPATMTALSDTAFGTESSSLGAFSAPSVAVGILFAAPACFLVAQPASQRVDRYLFRRGSQCERLRTVHD